MSTVLIRREQHIAITAAECGREFSNASADVQAAFLRGALEALREPEWGVAGTGAWSFQCRAIIDEIQDSNVRGDLAWMLGQLVDHLREPVDMEE